MSKSIMRMSSAFILGWMVVSTVPCTWGLTDPQDASTIYDFYGNLGFPLLPGWRLGGDPCLESWQGVECVNSNITAIILNGANLGGLLSESLGNFLSIITIDLSNNHIGGSIPKHLPITMRKFFLSGNQFTGIIPSSLGNLTLLTDMAVNENHLEGELPDAFQYLTSLNNLDLSSNNLSGQLPPSMGNLSALSTLHVQNNHLSGMLNILQDLSLDDLNIENNLFSGPIPDKLLSIPNFRKDGNPFNTTVPPSSAPAFPPSSLSGAPVASSDGPNISLPSNSSRPHENEGKSTTKVIVYAAIAVATLLMVVLIVVVCISKLRKRLQHKEVPDAYKGKRHKSLKGPMNDANLIVPNIEKKIDVPKYKLERQKEPEIDVKENDVLTMPPLAEKITAEPIVTAAKNPHTTHQNLTSQSSAPAFSVASLQQYTNSFAEENLICKDKLCKVYLAELPNGKLLTVTKLDNESSKIPDNQFLDLVLSISKLRHPYILELVGYCAEYDQRLLVYNYFSKRTLHDTLHCEDDLRKKLSWHARVGVALDSARALEYLHEGCRPPVIHQHFDAAKILLDDGLAVCVTECGFASLTPSKSLGQVPSVPTTYEAAEVNELGTYDEKTDVYSFGVVMLELLTGREPYDSSRPRDQRYLVRWASSRLYDINELSRIVDPSLEGNVPMKSLSWFADIINRCIQQQPEFRPPMSEVVQDLSRMIEDARINARRTPPNLL